MEKRVRSPNYPAFSLPEAIEKATILYRNLHTHSAPREVVVKNMGYNSLNGASATAVSALGKYGLLERTGDELKISERALRILHPHSSDERAAAIREAAQEPPLFNELAERFPGRIPNEELLRNYLVRKGFAPSAIGPVILAYRETSDFVNQGAAGYDPRGETTPEPAAMSLIASPHTSASIPQAAQAATTPAQEHERSIARYDFEGGGYVRVMAAGNIETDEALEMVETLIALKRSELERKRKAELSRANQPANADVAKNESEDDDTA